MNTNQDDLNLNGLVVASYTASSAIPDLNEEIWSSCKPVHIMQTWAGTPSPNTRHAEVRLCWNADALHVRFICEQWEPFVISSEPITDKKTIGLWDRDVCEIFIAPDPQDLKRYFEFEAAPTGEWIDLEIQISESGKHTNWDYASGMKTATQIENERFRLSMTIPFRAGLAKPEKGSQWRVNLFRCVGPDEETRYLAWRPTRTREPNFHVPEAFGVLHFA